MSKVKAIPEGFHTVTAEMAVEGCSEAIEFWKKAFGAEVVGQAMDHSGKKVMHAAIRIGDSIVFANDVFPEMGGKNWPAQMWLYVDNVDAWFKRAVDAGGKAMMPPMDMFWGDRFARVGDRWGNEWSIATHVKDMTPEEMKKAEQEFTAQMAQKKQ